jgi:hypothetical protein
VLAPSASLPAQILVNVGEAAQGIRSKYTGDNLEFWIPLNGIYIETGQGDMQVGQGARDQT